MLVRFYFDWDTVTDEEHGRLKVFLETLSSAGLEVWATNPPDAYVLVQVDQGRLERIASSLPVKVTRVLITDVVNRELGEQLINSQSSELLQGLAELIDIGLPVVTRDWPKTPRQGFYRDKDHLHGVVYLHSKNESQLRLVVRVEGLIAASALRFYADILSGSVQPLAWWDDSRDLEWSAIEQANNTASVRLSPAR